MPAMLSVVVSFDVMSVVLLVGDYRDRGNPRLLMMAWAYAWSLVAMGGYALAFPGAVATQAPLSLTPSMAPYLYLIWHTGFPLLLGIAWVPLPLRWTVPIGAHRRGNVAAVSVAIALAVGVGTVALTAAFAHRLPVLINGLDTSAMTRFAAPVVVPLVVVALVATAYGTRRRTGPERWATIAVLVCVCDLVLTFVARSRYSLGWYCGRTLTLVASGVLLIAMLASFRRLKARAEHEAGTDPLTGLCNRRSAQLAFDQLVARCRRSGAALGVLSLDLDKFKQINDRHGHETGDSVLTEVGHMLTRFCRYGDIVARVGGEEFLMLLPDSDEQATRIVAEKVRILVSDLIVPGMPDAMTASLGGTTMRKDDLTTATMLRRVDAALYQAKHTGRNRVVMAFTSTDVPPSPRSRQFSANASADRYGRANDESRS